MNIRTVPRNLLGVPLILVGILVISDNVSAQETAVIEEIVVTAAKRETSLQDTPIAITALTGDTLDAFNIQNGHDMLSSVIGPGGNAQCREPGDSYSRRK